MIKQCKHESRKRTEVIHFLDGSSVCFQFHDIATLFSEFKLYNVNFTYQLFKKTKKQKKTNKQQQQQKQTNKKINVYLLQVSLFSLYIFKISSHYVE